MICTMFVLEWEELKESKPVVFHNTFNMAEHLSYSEQLSPCRVSV